MKVKHLKRIIVGCCAILMIGLLVLNYTPLKSTCITKGITNYLADRKVGNKKQKMDKVMDKVAKVTTYPVPSDAPVSGDFSVTANGKSVGIYNAGNNTWGNAVSFGSFDFSRGTVKVSITVNSDFTSYKLVPTSLGISSTQSGNTITFSISKPTKVSLVFNDDYHEKALHLFAEAPDSNIPSEKDENVIYYKAGYYDLGETPIVVESNKTVYLEAGAYVRGRFLVQGADNVTIRGRGVLYDDRGISTGHPVPIVIENSTNVTVKDIIVNKYNPNWTGLMVASKNINLINFKAVSPIFTSSDGFDISVCQNVLYDNCFFRVADDCVAIKGYTTDLANENITIQNCQFWSDVNNIICLGVETKAAYYNNITVKDCDVLAINDHHYDMGAFSIESNYGTVFSNIVFENIRVEASCNRLINYYYTTNWYNGSLTGDQSNPGFGNSLTFKNINVTGTGANRIKIQGWDEGKQFSNIKLENIVINGEYIKSLSDAHFDINRFTKSIDIVYSDYVSGTSAAGLDFSKIQGENNWYYKQLNGNSYTDMTWDDTRECWVGKSEWCTIKALEMMHPDSNDVVRAWKAPNSGDVQIKGKVNKWDLAGGDGVKVKIMKNDTQIWPTAGWGYIAYDDKIGLLHDILISVEKDDYIYFIVNQNNTLVNDLTFWDTTVSYTTKYNAAIDFTMTQNGMCWGYKEWNGSSYVDMTWNSDNQQWEGSHTYSVINNGCHIHPDTYDSIISWTAPKSGTIDIGGVARKINLNGGDGVRIKIMKNNDKIWPSTDWQVIEYNNDIGVAPDVTVDVSQGDIIYFVLNQNGTSVCDSTYWVPNIEYQKK